MSNINFDSCSITAKTSVLANSAKKYLQIELKKKLTSDADHTVGAVQTSEPAVRNGRVEDVVRDPAEDVVRDPAEDVVREPAEDVVCHPAEDVVEGEHSGARRCKMPRDEGGWRRT